MRRLERDDFRFGQPLSAIAQLVAVPSPLVGKDYSDFQSRRLGEGSATPHPTERQEILAMPSPTRGEGASTGAVESISIQPALGERHANGIPASPASVLDDRGSRAARGTGAALS